MVHVSFKTSKAVTLTLKYPTQSRLLQFIYLWSLDLTPKANFYWIPPFFFLPCVKWEKNLPNYF